VKRNLKLLLGNTILEEGEVRSGTILTVVQQGDHAIGIHALTSVEFVVLEVTEDLLDKNGSVLLKDGDTLRVGFIQLDLKSLHVTLDVGHVRLLIESGFDKTRGVDNVVDGLRSGISTFIITTLSRRVGSNINIVIRDGDELTVDFESNIIDFIDGLL
jgi:hypothetical protein